MRIERIRIRNFRSIKDIVIEPGHLCALIGPNGSGKTNILKAIDLVLGEGWISKAKVARELFFDPKQAINIEIEFESAVSVSGNYGQRAIKTIELEMTLEPELAAKTTYNGGQKFYESEQFKKACHFVYIPSERQLSSELRVSQWTMLGKLMKVIFDNYIAHYGDEGELRKEFSKQMEAPKQFLETDFSPTEVTFKKFVDSFQKHCRENSAGLSKAIEPVLNIYNLNWFYKTLQIQVWEESPGKNFDSEEVGAGMQNLLMLSIFQTYAELMGKRVIFGIEEPEIFLYPPAQRSLYENFVSLSLETQLFYTTHNPNFVDAGRPDNIVLIRKSPESGTVSLEKDSYFNSIQAEAFKYRIYSHFNPERNEIFFAKKILLVEGDSDKILFTTLCEKRWNINLNQKGIVIISCGGKGGVNYFVGVCGLIGVNDFFAVWDKDEDIEGKEHLSVLPPEGKGLELSPNLEGFLGLPEGKGAEKIKNSHVWASDLDRAIPNEFDAVQIFLNANPLESSGASGGFPEEDSEIRVEDIPF